MNRMLRRFADICRRILVICAIPVAMLVVPEVAHSHTAPFGITGYPILILHPFIVLDHALCIVAAALLGGQQESLGFPRSLASLLAGQAAGFTYLVLVPSSAFEPFLPIGFAAVLGLLVALAPRLNRYLAAGAVFAAGFAVGLNTYPEDGLPLVLAMTLGGLMLGSTVLFTLVGWPVSRLKKDWQRIGVRIAGSWLAASVCLVLALAFRP